MEMNQLSAATRKVAELYADIVRRAGASAFGSCPVELIAAFVRMCLAQSCGKCVPCRVGLDRLGGLLEKIAAGEAEPSDLALLKGLALSIYDSADCAIGFEAAKLVLDGLTAFNDDYVSHVEKGVCTANFGSVPCQTGCPAHVNIPGYIACIGAGRYADAVRVIRQTNPFPAVCGLICEHPCEKYCRRNVVDDALNIRGLKRYAVEKAGDVPAPAGAPKNGKTVGIIGGGPAGLTAAYFLALRGFEVTVVIGGIPVRACVASGLANARKVVEDIRNGKSQYDFVEIMACPGGCAGGGGQPIFDGCELAEERGDVLYKLDAANRLRFSHENPSVQALYKEFLEKPLSPKAHELLHTDQAKWTL